MKGCLRWADRNISWKGQESCYKRPQLTPCSIMVIKRIDFFAPLVIIMSRIAKLKQEADNDVLYWAHVVKATTFRFAFAPLGCSIATSCHKHC